MSDSAGNTQLHFKLFKLTILIWNVNFGMNLEKIKLN